MAELIEKELQKFDAPEEAEIFFSAHGVPVSYVEQVRRRGHCLSLAVLQHHPFLAALAFLDNQGCLNEAALID